MTATTGILLVNLGTPTSPALFDVRRYLKQFLMDPRVIDLPTVARWLLVRGIILPFRTRKTSALYQKIWQPEGSPLMLHSRGLTNALKPLLDKQYVVAFGMRYGSAPSIADGLDELLQQGIQKLIVLPLFPQYSSAANGSAIAEVLRVLGQKTNIPDVQIIHQFYQHPAYLHALSTITRPHLEAFQPDFTLFSYHGLPERQINKSEDRHTVACNLTADCPAISVSNQFCYRAQCYATSRSLAASLPLDKNHYGVGFQSRLGKLPWIKPYTDEWLPRLAQQGVKRLAIISPSFVADCLETLEELHIRAREQWYELGGDELLVIPALNTHPEWVLAVKEILSV